MEEVKKPKRFTFARIVKAIKFKMMPAAYTGKSEWRKRMNAIDRLKALPKVPLWDSANGTYVRAKHGQLV